MRKSLILSVAVLGTIGAYALSGLYPDTTEFPRIPVGTGTLGQVIAKILGTVNFEGSDGTVNNTSYFSGISGTGYLHTGNCGTLGQVWIGVNPNGTPICGNKKPLLAFGTLGPINGTVTVIRYSDGSNVPGAQGLPLYAGDIVTTDTASAAEITFPSDNSILRLDELTNVELQFGTLGGNTVAQAIVNDGALWGRVLTSTGMNFGSAGYIAGVRGTSISVKAHGGLSVDFIAPHSMRRSNVVTYTYLAAGTTYTTGTGQSIHGYSGYNTLINPYPMLTGVDLLYGTDPWILRNTKRDIIRMERLLRVGGMSLNAKNTLQDELAATLPTSSSPDCTALLGGNIEHEDEAGTGSIPSNIPLAVCANPSRESVACGVQGKLYWQNLLSTGVDICQSSNIIALADFVDDVYMPGGTRLVSPLRGITNYFSQDQATSHGTITTNGLSITNSGTYLSYATGGLSLSGNIVTIELEFEVPTGTKHYIADFGSTNTFYLNASGLLQCGFRSGNICQTGDFTKISTTKYQLKVPVNPTQMIIGNQFVSGSYPWPIGTTIKKITISTN